MMNKDRIKEHIDELRAMARKLERKYRELQTDESFSDLMVYKEKIDSWKRVLEIAPEAPRTQAQPQPEPFRPAHEMTLAEILGGARLPAEGE